MIRNTVGYEKETSTTGMYAIRARRFTVRTLSYDPLHTLSYITSVFVARANQIIHRPRRVLFPARPATWTPPLCYNFSHTRSFALRLRTLTSISALVGTLGLRVINFTIFGGASG
jgi:hypothetical protein